MVIITLLLGLGVWQVQSNQDLFLNHSLEENSDSTQNSLPQLDSKEVITQYYQLATSNRTAALELLSDEYKNQYRQNSQRDSAKSFWNTINKVEIYAFLTLSNSENKYQIKVWLKYFRVDGYIACESQVIESVKDSHKNRWLINNISNIKQKPNCTQ